jgi:hypothetical protein
MNTISSRIVSRIVVAVFAVALASFAVANQHLEAGSWTGFVTDTACAAKGASASHADCAVKCVKDKGAKWALYNAANKETYVLTGKDDPSKWAGKEVTVKGTLNKETKSIEISSVEAAPAKK